MVCAYLFAVIGALGIYGAIGGNTKLVLIVGSISGYFLQLVLLPIIMVGQNVQSEASDARMERLLKHISDDNDRILKDIEKWNGQLKNEQ